MINNPLHIPESSQLANMEYWEEIYRLRDKILEGLIDKGYSADLVKQALSSAAAHVDKYPFTSYRAE